MANLPAKEGFSIQGTWLDSGYYHPLSAVAKAAIDQYLHLKMADGSVTDLNVNQMQESARARFAGLINAAHHEVSFVPSATTAENLICAALRLSAGDEVITDALHFEGSRYLYERLGGRGIKVTVVDAVDGGIDYADLEIALKGKVRLVALSHISQITGFQHDLAKVCALAHASGAVVYADLTQSAGALEIDVQAAGVDFCGCSTYKWLMSEMGLGLLYVAAGSMVHLTAPQFGPRQLANAPYQPGAWSLRPGAAGYFEVGTINNVAVAALDASLEWLEILTVAAVATHSQRLLAQLRTGVAELGYSVLTPRDAKGPILAIRVARWEALKAALAEAGIYATVYEGRFRVAPSIFNSEQEVDRLLQLLAADFR